MSKRLRLPVSRVRYTLGTEPRLVRPVELELKVTSEGSMLGRLGDYFLWNRFRSLRLSLMLQSYSFSLDTNFFSASEIFFGRGRWPTWSSSGGGDFSPFSSFLISALLIMSLIWALGVNQLGSLPGENCCYSFLGLLAILRCWNIEEKGIVGMVDSVSLPKRGVTWIDSSVLKCSFDVRSGR